MDGGAWRATVHGVAKSQIHTIREGRGCTEEGGAASVYSPAPRGLLSSVQSLSHAQLFSTPWTAARQASLSITNSWSLLKLMSVTTRKYIFEFF